MDYLYKVDTAHSTYTRNNPKRTTVKLSRGRITGGFIYFPSGPAGTLNLTVVRAGYQIAPVDPQQSYALDDCVIPISPGYDLDQPPYVLTLLTWNDSTQYSHTLTISFILDPFFGRPPKRPFLSSLFRPRNKDLDSS